MPRFSDEWVLDRVLFDYVSGGSCACCGFQHLLPGGSTADLIGAVTDLETDQAAAEVAALQFHPWPVDLRDQIWADRVKLRQKLKREMPAYAEFWKMHGETFSEWCRENAVNKVQRLLQLPRSEVMETIQQKYGIHSAFGVVLCTVTEQVANFDLTKYPADARGDDGEVEFEENLQFGRRGGFTLRVLDEAGRMNPEVLQIWIKRMQTLAGPKLLGRTKKPSSNDEDDEDDEGDTDTAKPVTPAAASSFASDRRIIRLLIARYWYDALMKSYLSEAATKVEDAVIVR